MKMSQVVQVLKDYVKLARLIKKQQVNALLIFDLKVALVNRMLLTEAKPSQLLKKKNLD